MVWSSLGWGFMVAFRRNERPETVRFLVVVWSGFKGGCWCIWVVFGVVSGEIWVMFVVVWVGVLGLLVSDAVVWRKCSFSVGFWRLDGCLEVAGVRLPRFCSPSFRRGRVVGEENRQ